MASSNTARLRSLPEAAERLGLSVKCLRGWVWRRIDPLRQGGPGRPNLRRNHPENH